MELARMEREKVEGLKIPARPVRKEVLFVSMTLGQYLRLVMRSPGAVGSK